MFIQLNGKPKLCVLPSLSLRKQYIFESSKAAVPIKLWLITGDRYCRQGWLLSFDHLASYDSMAKKQLSWGGFITSLNTEKKRGVKKEVVERDPVMHMEASPLPLPMPLPHFTFTQHSAPPEPFNLSSLC